MVPGYPRRTRKADHHMAKMTIIDVAPETVAHLTTSSKETPVTETVKVETPKAKFAEQDAYLDILAKHIVPYSVQSGFIRVEGPKGNRLYIANTKTVRRVDISGFEASWVIAKLPHCGPFGSVKQQMLMDGTPSEQLARFELLVETLLAQPAKEKAPKKEKVEEKVAASES